MLKILTAPHPTLSQKAKPVLKIDKGAQRLIGEMKESLAYAKDPIGVGLAAVQVGKNLRIFIAKPGTKAVVFTLINPKIITQKDKLSAATRLPKPGTGGQEPAEHKPLGHARKLEGCLSLPNIWGDVQRHDEIFLEYLDEGGKAHKRKFKGFLATIVQHELDHLNGVLFPKRVLEQKGTLYKSEKDEKGEDVFEELKV